MPWKRNILSNRHWSLPAFLSPMPSWLISRSEFKPESLLTAACFPVGANFKPSSESVDWLYAIVWRGGDYSCNRDRTPDYHGACEIHWPDVPKPLVGKFSHWIPVPARMHRHVLRVKQGHGEDSGFHSLTSDGGPAGHFQTGGIVRLLLKRAGDLAIDKLMRFTFAL